MTRTASHNGTDGLFRGAAGERHPRTRWSRTLPPRNCPRCTAPSSTESAQLEAGGQRGLANRVRADAIKIYSRAWDDRARRELTALLRRNAGEPVDQTTVGRGIRRRTIRAA